MEKYYLGIDIGGTSIKAGIVDKEGNILAKSSCKTGREREASIIVKDIIELAKNIIFENGYTYDNIKGVGMGIPGSIDSKEGVIIYANNILFENVPIVKLFNEEINIPTIIDNDANAAGLGEMIFANEDGYKNLVFITLGTGVGGGIIIDGKIYSGNKGVGAEVGHMSIMVDGRQCNCGNIGCWETYASATALISDTKAKMEKNPDSLMNKIAKEDGRVTGRTAFKARRLGDKAASEVIDDYVKYVGTGLGNLGNILRPEAILIGGGISNEGEYFIDMLQKYINKCLYCEYAAPVKVKRAKLLNDAGILGAASLAINI